MREREREKNCGTNVFETVSETGKPRLDTRPQCSDYTLHRRMHGKLGERRSLLFQRRAYKSCSDAKARRYIRWDYELGNDPKIRRDLPSASSIRNGGKFESFSSFRNGGKFESFSSLRNDGKFKSLLCLRNGGKFKSFSSLKNCAKFESFSSLKNCEKFESLSSLINGGKFESFSNLIRSLNVFESFKNISKFESSWKSWKLSGNIESIWIFRNSWELFYLYLGSLFLVLLLLMHRKIELDSIKIDKNEKYLNTKYHLHRQKPV